MHLIPNSTSGLTTGPSSGDTDGVTSFHDAGASPSSTQPLKCLVIGHHGRLFAANEQISWLEDPTEPFDVVLAASSASEVDFAAFVATATNPIAPLLAIDASFGARADLVLEKHQPTDFVAAFARVQEWRDRVQALPPLPAGRDRNALLALAMMHTRQRALTPSWCPEAPLSMAYAELLGVPDSHRVLRDLHDRNLVSREFHERLHVCSHCDSSRLHAREVCVNCQSSHLDEQMLVHHYRCSHQAVLAEFESDDGLRCPKCRKALRHYGVDYDKPGHVATCRNCSLPMSDPAVGFVCADCGGHTAGDDAGQRYWYEYSLLPEALNTLRTGTLSVAENRLGRAEFLKAARGYLEVAIRCDRPISAVEVILTGTGQATHSETRQEEAAVFLSTIVAENARRGDLITAIDGGSVVCLPETNEQGAQLLLERMNGRVSTALHPSLKTVSRVIARSEMSGFLMDLI